MKIDDLNKANELISQLNRYRKMLAVLKRISETSDGVSKSIVFAIGTTSGSATDVNFREESTNLYLNECVVVPKDSNEAPAMGELGSRFHSEITGYVKARVEAIEKEFESL